MALTKLQRDPGGPELLASLQVLCVLRNLIAPYLDLSGDPMTKYKE